VLYLSTTNLVSDGHRACLPRKLRGVVGDYLDLICIRTLQAPVDITVHPGKWDVKLTMSRQIIATCKSLITTLKTRWFLLANNSSTELNKRFIIWSAMLIFKRFHYIVIKNVHQKCTFWWLIPYQASLIALLCLSFMKW